MYIKPISSCGSNPVILLHESKRENRRIKKHTLINLTNWPDDLVSTFRFLLKGESLAPIRSFLTIEASLPPGYVDAILETTRRLTLEAIIAAKSSERNDASITAKTRLDGVSVIRASESALFSTDDTVHT